MKKIKNSFKKATDDNSDIVRRNESIVITIKGNNNTVIIGGNKSQINMNTGKRGLILHDLEQQIEILKELIKSKNELIELLRHNNQT